MTTMSPVSPLAADTKRRGEPAPPLADMAAAAGATEVLTGAVLHPSTRCRLTRAASAASMSVGSTANTPMLAEGERTGASAQTTTRGVSC